MNDRVRKRVEKLIQPPQEITLYAEVEFTYEQYYHHQRELGGSLDDHIKQELAKKMVDRLLEAGVINFNTLENFERRSMITRATIKAKSQYATVNEDLII